jgi:hypothetical protein
LGHFGQLAKGTSVLEKKSGQLNLLSQKPQACAPFRYRVYGIVMASEVPLNLPEVPVNAVADVELRIAQPGAFASLRGTPKSDPNDWFRHAILEDESLYLRWEGWVEFLVSRDGRVVLCENLSNLAFESFEAYLTTFAVSAALLQQGEETLHATGVKIGRRSVGFVGPSGAGKSTLAAHLISKGASLVTDDMLRVTWNDEIAIAHPGPFRLKLFEESAKQYLRGAICRGRYNPLSGKLLFQPSGPFAVGPQRLSALYQLQQHGNNSNSNGVSLKRLSGLDLFTTIAASTRNSRISLPGRSQSQFYFVERIAKAIPVYRLCYYRTYNVLNKVANLIFETAKA